MATAGPIRVIAAWTPQGGGLTGHISITETSDKVANFLMMNECEPEYECDSNAAVGNGPSTSVLIWVYGAMLAQIYSAVIYD